MSVQDITPDSVLAAIRAGHDDLYKLAAHFEVLAAPSSTLYRTMRELQEAGRIVMANHFTDPIARWAVA